METVKQSLNIPTIRLLMKDVHLDAAYNYAKRLGLPVTPEDKNPAAMALGGMMHGVSTRDMAQAYAVFPNWGSYMKAHTIIRVVGPDGKDVPPNDADEINQQKQVFDARSTYWMTRMLKQVVRPGGTGEFAQLKDGRPVAGKTGTTHEEKAAWFVGYTSNLVCAVNVFYPNPKDATVPVVGGSAPARIFSYVMSRAVQGLRADDFTPPPGTPEPTPPFQLEAPHVHGEFVPDQSMIRLTWQQQSDHVRYEIYQMDDSGKLQKIGDAGPGSTEYDVQVDATLDNQGQNGGQGKTYKFKVVAIDTQADDLSQAQKSSNVVAVTVEPKKVENPTDLHNRNNPNNPNNPNSSNNSNNPNNQNNPINPINPNNDKSKRPKQWWNWSNPL
jgi:membrane peptidoglycan carboxypeptidase